MDEDEYEVEEVINEKDGMLLVKWVGWKKPTWEPIAAIPQDLYNKYLKAQNRYEVEKILDDKNGKVLVKWVGWKDPTWEPLKEISEDVYEQYINKKKSYGVKNPNDDAKADTSTTTNKYLVKRKTVKPNLSTSAENTTTHDTNLNGKEDTSKTEGKCVKRKTLKRNLSTSFEDNSASDDLEDSSESDDEVRAKKKPKNNFKKVCTRHCIVCTEPDEGGRSCVSCKKPVHHMCSNELIQSLGAEEVIDVCYCSKECFEKITQQSNDTNIIGKNVAYSPDCEKEWLSPRLYSDVGSLYLVGVIARHRKSEYEIRWTISEYQGKQHIHYVSFEKAQEGISNFEKVNKSRFGLESWDVLCKPFDEKDNPADLWDEFEEVDEQYMRYECDYPLPIDLKEVEKIKSMEFRADATLSPPEDLFCHDDGTIETRLKESKKYLFQHSASSAFFAFLPLSFWRKVVENTNLYAEKDKQPVITLDELMKFWGILFYMSTVDKGEYANYWGDQVENSMFNESSIGLDRVMNLKRFKFIRKNLCFRAGVTLDDLKADPAARIRPLINILKVRCPDQVELGRNVAVDETSIACRSKFARGLILYNATKPTGKYHFKIYMCCCSTTWFAMNFKLHCSSSLEERLAGTMNQSDINAHRLATEASSDVRKHVLEVTIPIHNTNRIVNTDNFYTSCQLLEALKVKGLYGRGTIRENSKLGPKAFMLSKKDKVPRGTTRQGVDIKHKIIGASWADGSMVNILSNADGSSHSTVVRMVGKTKTSFTAPSCISEYNKAMQGVDRIDQLRARFSIADGHSFKKWHIKLAMAFIDIARCNGYICRKMSGVQLHPRDPHREYVMDLISELINGEWQNVPGDVGLLHSTPVNLSRLPSIASPRIASPCQSPARPTVDCVMTSSKQVYPKSRAKRECVICRFEGRYPSEQTVICSAHHIAACTLVRKSPVLQPFVCPNTELTCWYKFHLFYLPAGLFNASGNIRRSCHLFKAKKQFEARSRPPQLATINEEQQLCPVDIPSVEENDNESVPLIYQVESDAGSESSFEYEDNPPQMLLTTELTDYTEESSFEVSSRRDSILSQEF